MTMEPTMQLRWLRRQKGFELHGEVRWMGSETVLQQLWVKSPNPYPGQQIVAGGEWRDIPEVRET